MNGHIIPNTNIAVDLWKIKGQSRNYIHFLTHTHGDHIVGLTSTWRQRIFCSEVTAMLLIDRHGVPKKFLNILPINDSVIIEVSKSECFTVTAYDANHCPGAVMFYFEGNFGSVLYTGDFRLNENILQICQNLSEKVDMLYLDNTFCSPKCIFPSRDECFNQIIDIIRQHPNHRVIICVRKLGKEILLGQLGVALNETICVSQECYKLCKALFSSDVFTTFALSKDIPRLSTLPMSSIGGVGSHLASLNKISPTIGIIPTALFTGYTSNMNCANIFVVPYSDHSSYTELHRFVAALKPARVVPIVTCTKGPFDTDLSDRLDMSCFNTHLSSPRFSCVKANQTAHNRENKQCEYTSVGSTKRKLACANEGVKKKAKGVVYVEEDPQTIVEEDTGTNGPSPLSKSLIIDLCSDSEFSEESDISETDDCVIVRNDKSAARKEPAVNTDSFPPYLSNHQLRGEVYCNVETSPSTETVSHLETGSHLGISGNIDTGSHLGISANIDTGSHLGISTNIDTSSHLGISINIDTGSHIDTVSSNLPKKAIASNLSNCAERKEKDFECAHSSNVIQIDDCRLRSLITSAVCSALLPLKTVCDCAGHNDSTKKSRTYASDPHNNGCEALLSCSEDSGCLNGKCKCSDEPNVLNTVSTADPKRFAFLTQKTEMAGKVLSKTCCKQSTDTQPHPSCSTEDSSSIKNVWASKSNASVSRELQSAPDYNIEFCLDCFRKMFKLSNVETKDKNCLVCAKSFIGSKVIVDKLFVKMLKDKFSL